MKFLSRTDFVPGSAGQKRRFAEFSLPWDNDTGIRIRSLTAKEHAEFEVATLTKKGGLHRDRLIEAKRRLLAMTLVDADGNPLLVEADVAAMESTDGRLVSFAYGKACEHCGITESEVEDLAKNSGTITAGDSSSA